jgi:hypothetical protein
MGVMQAGNSPRLARFKHENGDASFGKNNHF